MSAGYSKTPLAKKLGIKEEYIALVCNAPDHYTQLFSDLPKDFKFYKQIENDKEVDFIHLFCKTLNDLKTSVAQHKPLLKKTGMLWVSWPKGSSKIKTELKREPIREHVLEVGLVDVKVAAIDEDWSGLKFVYRLKDR